MNKQASVGEKVAQLNALRGALEAPESRELLRRSLADRSNHVVERAADLIGETVERDLVPALLEAYRRLLINPLKKDPGCVGKTAIVRTLVRLEYDEVAFFQEGTAYEQPEPIWGGHKDTAAALRGLSAVGLADCANALEVLNRCAVLLADRWVDARTGAVQAIAALGQPQGVPLLRFKLLVGDASPEVTGECCLALLQLARDEGLEFVVPLLSSTDEDTCVQVALALGESRHRGAFQPLRAAWEHQASPTVRESLLLCIGLLRSSESGQFLLSLIDDVDLRAAADAVRALKIQGGDGMRQQVAEAILATGSERLQHLFEQEWGGDAADS